MVETVSGYSGGDGGAEPHRAERPRRNNRSLYWCWLVMLAWLFLLPAMARSADAAQEVPAKKDEASSESGYYHLHCPPRGGNATFIPSEQLEGVLFFEIGDIDWGRPGSLTQNGTSMKDKGDAAGP